MNIQTALKQAFERGEKLTVLEALHRYGTSELRHYVTRLRTDGDKIVSKWQEGEGKRWKIYWLDKKPAA